MTRFEPPYTEPYVRWCGRSGSVRTRTYPIIFEIVEFTAVQCRRVLEGAHEREGLYENSPPT